MVDVRAVAEHVVRQSASMLDRISPDWWTPERVNLDTLDINSGTFCLIAQSFGAIVSQFECCRNHSYNAGLDRVEALLSDAGIAVDNHGRFPAQHGFAGGDITVDPEIFPDVTEPVYISSNQFTAPWVKVIRERRDAANDPLMKLLNA